MLNLKDIDKVVLKLKDVDKMDIQFLTPEESHVRWRDIKKSNNKFFSKICLVRRKEGYDSYF